MPSDFPLLTQLVSYPVVGHALARYDLPDKWGTRTMTISMYQASVPVFTRLLGNCAAFLQKAETYALTRDTDAYPLLEQRLAPDMFPLKIQVQILADGVRGCTARLARHELPAPDDWRYAVFNRGYHQDFQESEQNFATLTAYIRDTVDYLQTIRPDEIDGTEELPVEVTWRGNTRHFQGLPFLRDYVLPNFYFHLTISYAILRIAGVPLGKQDFEGMPVYVSVPTLG
ncbi:DUF1993 domain-containing protein [Phyllobacterium sp. OV277]|uniref:DUF1993 domain-containing protein n=1 Tax=Phyllobacterium sp. OV277 TaxID=1882772 RepID=UPI0008812B5E|nr:DUF1993 domain-containing protein [Phyllobacterium sp. OV277]SDO76114.1 hypothetical protein SAMN05443582_102994 [Phyllobacterium sp. OV277]